MNYLTSIAKTWNSLNPATLSGAIDVIVIEDEKGNLNCSPFHIRFGKFQLLRPSQKKVNFKVNGELTNIQMKLGDGGEAFFVFQTDEPLDQIPNDMMTSPVVSAASSALSSPLSSPKSEPITLEDPPDYLDLGPSQNKESSCPPTLNNNNNESSIIDDDDDDDELDEDDRELPSSSLMKKSRTMSSIRSLSPSRAEKLSKRLTMKNIPTKIDSNGELVLDISGYKPSEKDVQSYDKILKEILEGELGDDYDLTNIMKYDKSGNIRIYSTPNHSDPTIDVDESHASGIMSSPSPLSSPASSTTDLSIDNDSPHYYNDNSGRSVNYIKTLRLTSDQLKSLNLKYGPNDMEFHVDQTKSVVCSRVFLWKYNVPVVISDIDGTITKSDALGHVFNMIGKDWTHEGVSKLFSDISMNGYNIMYLTARSVGLADTTRSYLDGIDQDGVKLPKGPVILSPDRTMAALRREVILKKPEVFKITCLNDLKNLYGNINETPFYAGFGNRITDALSYRSVEIPSSKIFTINPDGDVHMELLELAGYKSSYIHINELVDHFFPPVNVDLLKSGNDKNDGFNTFIDENFTDAVFWRDPIPDFTDSESEENIEESVNGSSLISDNTNTESSISDKKPQNEDMKKVDEEIDKNLIGEVKTLKINDKIEKFNDKEVKNNREDSISEELDEYDNTIDDLEQNFDEDYEDDEDEDYELEEDEEDEEEYEEDDENEDFWLSDDKEPSETKIHNTEEILKDFK